MLLVCGLALTVAGLALHKPVLYLFGASDDTYRYAADYLAIYLLGTVFVMTSLGLNPYINSQGFARIGMLTVLLGAAANIVLDPILIYACGLGVRGAAIATVYLPGALRFAGCCGSSPAPKPSCAWSVRRAFRPDWACIRRIAALGTSSFVMSLHRQPRPGGLQRHPCAPSAATSTAAS